jgi:hypothetical protein
MDLVDRVISDVLEHVAQITFRIQAAQFGGADEAIKCGGALTAGIRACKEKMFPLMYGCS